ncbi:MAG: GNAT family N-acetyltransferase [Candidatus Korarchaeota archaeon]|nr:GNAT family N-acetyltransferase [Candidatus Korarchaeota archaeon]NIU84766.1 GNAT family N-acetyltransferase [Candidatus Thorarchaeota archaeon]NIW14399.1 GNAT family N-acetyltransferase [Candidatus Thorarchaeota archaeon]NIW52840.1 GNAT family N-acetyltransferase [Candidatus Korarchaeota archaeon]
MVTYREINFAQDKEFLLQFHVKINYASETPFIRKVMNFTDYKEKWFNTSQPQRFLRDLKDSLKESRTIAQIVENAKGEAIGYLWVTFTDVTDYNVTIAEIMDIAVKKEFQGQGIGTNLMEYLENLARERGAHFLRSDTGSENRPSRALHEKVGFTPYRIIYEKVLCTEDIPFG